MAKSTLLWIFFLAGCTSQSNSGIGANAKSGSVSVTDLAPGDLLITEIMGNPVAMDDRSGEWIEVANQSGASVDLQGLVIEDLAGNQGRIADSVVLDHGAIAMLGRATADVWTDSEQKPLAHYGAQPSFNNDGDAFSLVRPDGMVIDGTARLYPVAGRSASLDLSRLAASANDLSESWCHQTGGSPAAWNGACDGISYALTDLLEGDLVVTEIMANPDAFDDTFAEWFEVYNRADLPVIAQGLVIVDETGNWGDLDGPAVIHPSTYAVFGRTDATGFPYSSFEPSAYYGNGPALNNGGDQITLVVPTSGMVLDQSARYTSGAAAAGISWELVGDPDAERNDDPTQWAAASCPMGQIGDFGTPGEAAHKCLNEEPTHTDQYIQAPQTNTDVLFVVDNSGSMFHEQASLTSNFDAFMAELVDQTFPWRIGVVTTDDATLRGDVIDQDTSDPQGTFAEQAQTGFWGSGFEVGLSSARYAINDGFSSKEAALHIVFVSDENDYSIVEVDDFVADIIDTKESPELVQMHAVVETEVGRCADAWEVGTRYLAAVSMTHGIQANICDADWGSTMAEIAQASTGNRSTFSLTEIPVEDTIVVLVDGNDEVEWSYASASNSIVFAARDVPDPGQAVEIVYNIDS